MRGESRVLGRPLLTLLPLLLISAGCLSGLQAHAPPDAPAAKQAFLTSDMTLAPQPDATQHAVREGSFFSTWAAGADYPTWLAAPQARSVLVENVTVHVFLRATGPVARTFRFPDVLPYAGSGGAWMAVGNATTPTVLVPGTTYEFNMTLAGPAGGMWIPQGERLGAKIAVVMHQNDITDVELLLGGATPSGLFWTERAGADAPTTYERGRAEGDVVGSAYAGSAAPESVRYAAPVHANATPRALLVWMNATDHQGIPDVDLEVRAPNGTVLAFSGTPTPREMVRLGPENLVAAGPGDYTVAGISYGSARAHVTLEWAVAP